LLACPLLCVFAVQQPRPEDQGPVFKTGTREVNLNLSVRDDHGRTVRNLKPEEIEIYEDGVRRPVTSFRFVAGAAAGERGAAPGEAARAAPAPARAAMSLPAVNYICVVFHNLDGHTIKWALDAAQAFLDHELQPGTGVALFSLGTRLHVLHGFTADHKKLAALAARSLDSPMPSFTSASAAALSAAPYMASIEVSAAGEATMNIAGGEVNLAAIAGADAGTSQADNMYRALLADQRSSFGHIVGMQMRDQINTMINELGPLPGRKTVLLLSSGLVNTLDPEMFKTLVDRAREAQIRIYAVDVNGMGMGANTTAAAASLKRTATTSRTQWRVSDNLAEARQKSRQLDDMEIGIRATDPQAPLRELAESTGGFLIANTEELDKPFERIHEDVDTHYEATYAPPTGIYDGRFHKIEVKVTRAGVNVQSRAGYYALPAGGDPVLSDLIGLAALNSAARPHAFDYRSAVLQLRPGRQALAFEVPAGRLAAQPAAAGTSRLKISVLSLVKNAAGEVVDKISQEIPYLIPGAQLDAMRKSAIPLSYPLNLPPGRYTVETAITDVQAGRVSVQKLAFDSPQPQPLGMTSIILVDRLDTLNRAASGDDPLEFAAPAGSSNGDRAAAPEARRVVPSLNTALQAGASPAAYFAVFPDESKLLRAPTLQLEFLVNGELVSKQSMALPKPDSSGKIPMLMRAAAHPGNCELRVTVTQGEYSVTRRLSYSIASR